MPGSSGEKRIDRRALIKGATAIGGAVWALPVVETIAMPAAFAGSAPPNTPLPGSLGAQYNPLVGLAPFTCGPLVNTGCLTNAAATPSGGCAVSQIVQWTATNGTLTIGILQGNHLVQGSAQAGSTCIPAVQVTLLGSASFSEYWAFSAGGGSFTAELLIVPVV